MGSMFFSMTCCRGGRGWEEHRNWWSGLHRPVGICVGVTWQGFGSRGTVRVASVRRCQKLPPRWTETILPLYLQIGVDSSWLRVKIFPVQSHQSKSWKDLLGYSIFPSGPSESCRVEPSGSSRAAFSLDELDLGWFITFYAEQIPVPRAASLVIMLLLQQQQKEMQAFISLVWSPV